jgi:hypothetical protein
MSQPRAGESGSKEPKRVEPGDQARGERDVSGGDKGQRGSG